MKTVLSIKQSVMKRTLLFSLYLLAFTSLSAQTAPIYLLFTRDCMDQLEYRYTYGTNTALTYSVHPRMEEQYLLTAGQPAITAPSLPPGTLNCREFNMNSAFVDAINKNARPVYMVHQTSSGYTLVPLASASQITRYGAVFQFRTPRYAFAVDTNNLVYEQNLALPGSNAFVYFSGVKLHSCRNEYSFRRVPTQTSPERSDFNFIAGVGIVNDRTGNTAAEAENNQLQLTKVNGLALEDFIASLCPVRGGSSVSKWAGQAGYGPTSSTVPPMNQDKELASIQQNGGIPTASTNTSYGRVANCPEPMGPGYHIMQPGETLNAVSRTYGVDVKSLVRWNKLTDPNKIQVCQKIWLKTPPTAKTSPKGVAPAPVQHAAKLSNPVPTVVNQSIYWNQPQQPYQPQQPPVAPSTYNYVAPKNNMNEYVAPQVGTQANPGKPAVTYTIQKGETLRGIARKNDLSEARLRMMNNMPATGNVQLRIGQKLVIEEATAPSPTVYPNLPAGTTNPTSGAFLTTPSNNPTPTQNNTSAVPPTQYNTTAPAPVQYNTTTPSATTQPVGEDRERFYETPVAGTVPTPPATVTPQTAASQLPAQTTAPNYQEYIVKEGETINSIAIKFKANAQELAIVNNKELTETLIAGQRILVPVKPN